MIRIVGKRGKGSFESQLVASSNFATLGRTSC